MIKYVIETIKTDLTNGNIVRSFSAPVYETPAAAHEVAREAGLVQFVKTEDGKRVRVCDYRVFPDTGNTDGIFDLARRMTRTACKLLIEKTGAGDVNTLNMLHALRASTYAESVTDYNAQECISAAVCETWAAIVEGVNLHEQAARALRAVYSHIRGERGYTNGRQARVLSLDSMDDKDIAYFNAIIDDVSSDIAEDEAAHGGKDAPRLIDAVNERLTADQRKVMLLLSEGMTQAQIARVLDRNESTISRHVKLSRAAIAAYMLETGAAIPDGVDVESIANMARYAADHRAADTLRKGGTAARTAEAEKRAAERAAILDNARRAEQEAEKRAEEARAAALARVAQEEAERAARLALCVSFNHVTRGEHVFAIIADEARAAANAAREEARRARLDVWQGQTAAAVARADKWRAVWQERAESAYNAYVKSMLDAWAGILNT